jgi:hypothetical protein
MGVEKARRELGKLRQQADGLAARDCAPRVTTLPPLEEFKRLRRSAQVDLLRAYDPPPRPHPGPPLPDLDVFESLPVEEMKRLMDEHMAKIPPDEHFKACFMSMDPQQQVELCMLGPQKSPPPEEVPARLRMARHSARPRKRD